MRRWSSLAVLFFSVLSSRGALAQADAPPPAAEPSPPDGAASPAAEQPSPPAAEQPSPPAAEPTSAPTVEPPPQPEVTLPAAAEAPKPPVTFSGSVEASYQWNLNQPSNGLTALRGFDNRSNTLTLQNATLGAALDVENVVANLTLQVGSTPDAYYAAEPALPGGAGVPLTDANLWKYVQQALVGYRLPVLEGLLLQSGVFLSPIGPESMAMQNNAHASRSNLFFGLPFYHTGARATLSLTELWSVTAGVVNGWNSVVDNNDEKTVYGSVNLAWPETLQAQVLAMSGVERNRDAPEGRAWRTTLDAFAVWTVTSWLNVTAHGDVGFEPNTFGVSSWGAAALMAQVKPWSWLALAARADGFAEQAAENDDGVAASIFWPVPWVASATLTAELRPVEHISLRLEGRHDEAGGDAFFRGDVVGDGADVPFVPNASSQDTVTAAVVAWF